MFGINGWEIPVLAIIALLVLGPDKLPKFAADAARMIRQVRRMATDARDEVTRDLGPEFRDIDLQDLNPRRFVTKHLLEGDSFGLDDDEPERPARRSSTAPRPRSAAEGTGRRALGSGGSGGRPGGSSVPGASGERPPYDLDAT
ncbi:sec-independent translocase [Vallicoccus soli]|uniref:Sec-independent protein translocase subunit TatB n=1 Tax=Vallicoccus soli TaxID=2339232 RepID=A0A3A3Z7Y8_9ACTN|nr:sec-independent translocase [Vallicoccus soli]RJK98037.1 Sec-independent protein translocase subunit TatB [Vallicoccus soli]